QRAQLEQLCVELLDGARGGRRVDELLLEPLELAGGPLVVVELVKADRELGVARLRRGAAGEDGLLAALEAGGAALERSADRLGARREAALQHREREPDGVAPLAAEL